MGYEVNAQLFVCTRTWENLHRLGASRHRPLPRITRVQRVKLENEGFRSQKASDRNTIARLEQETEEGRKRARKLEREKMEADKHKEHWETRARRAEEELRLKNALIRGAGDERKYKGKSGGQGRYKNGV